MGSFNATCIISNLPIEAGTPVRFFLLTESYHRGNEHSCYVWGRWQLRGPAVRAKYNDYGSVKDIQDTLALKLMFEALSRDVVEKGVGDNQYHDVQVRPGMSQKDWLEALWEGRVFVTKWKPSKLSKDWKPPEPEEGMPSLARLEKILVDAGHAVVTDYGAAGYFLDKVNRGFIRVRHGRTFKDEGVEPLEQVLPLFHKAGYAAMVTCGTGGYPNHAEVLVAPLPGKSWHTTGLAEDKLHSSLVAERPVSQVMVREDVWQILLKTCFTKFWDDETYDIDGMKKDALSWLKTTRDGEKELAALSPQEAFERSLKSLEGPDMTNRFSCAIYGGEGVSGFSLRDAFKLGIRLAENDAELEEYVLDLAEIAYVQEVYGGPLHGQWHPTTNSGQNPCWEEHRAFLKELSVLRGKYEDDDETDDDETDEDDDSNDAAP